MVIDLSIDQEQLLAGAHGEAAASAMRILVDMAGAMGAESFVQVSSAHVDGCLLHGASGVAFAEFLADKGARVRIPTSLNVGAMDLVRPDNVHLAGPERDLAVRLMNAYVQMGCTPTWTCAPYQAGHRPATGEHVAWAESNAVVFANSVLGARTNRYGDFMDICCALTGLAPYCGLHVQKNRRASVVVETAPISSSLKRLDAFYAVLGSWLGRETGSEIAVIEGLPGDVTEDQLKALGAAAASTGAVGMFHVTGVTPEAGTVEEALGGRQPSRIIQLTPGMVIEERDRMSTALGTGLDVVAVGSPHFSHAEFGRLLRLFDGRIATIPVYACTGRHVLAELENNGQTASLEAAGVTLIADTCVVVTPVIDSSSGVLMTNSGKFAHYSDSLIGHGVVFGSLAECVESAVEGRVVRDPGCWEEGAE